MSATKELTLKEVTAITYDLKKLALKQVSYARNYHMKSAWLEQSWVDAVFESSDFEKLDSERRREVAAYIDGLRAMLYHHVLGLDAEYGLYTWPDGHVYKDTNERDG